jgi:DNA-binding NarL/FixJ family response regulator
MRAVIAEDSVLLRMGLVKVLQTAGFDVAASVGDAQALLVAVAQHINNIFAKLDLPPADGDHRRVLAVLRFLGGPGGPANWSPPGELVPPRKDRTL